MLNLNLAEHRLRLAELCVEHLGSVTAQSSIKEDRIYIGSIKDDVVNYLLSQLDKATVSMMPIIHTVNLCKRIVNKEASIYRQDPIREIHIKNEAQKAAIQNIYDCLQTKQKLTRANRCFKNSGQCFLQLIHIESKKKLELRILKKHQCFVIPKANSPKEIDVFVTIGYDPLDISKRIYAVWTNELNFIMDDNGTVLSGDMKNPIGLIPVIEIANEDLNSGHFYNVEDQTLQDFTIQINAALSDLFHIMRQQGYAIPLIKGPMQVLKALELVKVGPTRVLKLPTDVQDAENKSAEVDFSFVSASPDLAASIDVISTLLSAFLSSRGVDPKTVNFKGDSKSYSSGWERFLALIESFEASQDDIGVFQEVEYSLFNLVVAYHNAFFQDKTKLLPQFTSSKITEASVSIKFAGPEVSETRIDKFNRLKGEKEAGIINQEKFIQEYFDMSEEEAKEYLTSIGYYEQKVTTLPEVTVELTPS